MACCVVKCCEVTCCSNNGVKDDSADGRTQLEILRAICMVLAYHVGNIEKIIEMLADSRDIIYKGRKVSSKK